MGRRTFAILTILPVLALSPFVIGQAPPVNQTAPAKPPRDLKHLTIQQRQFYLSGQRGMEWLVRANKPDGRFVAGFLPALRLPMEGDNYMRQLGAAFALARAGKYYGDEQAIAVARQAVLTLLLETTTDPSEPRVRTVPRHLANPVQAAGMLLAAIHELPIPAADLLEQADQLANMLQKRLRTDGSIMADEPGEEAHPDDTAQHFAGPALYGLVRSHAQRPDSWKTAAVSKARNCYVAYWNQNKNVNMAPWHSATYAEAYLATKEPAYADAVFAMNDWLLRQQYGQALPGQPAWTGGFQPWTAGKAAAAAPDIGSAAALASIAEGLRLARATGDVQHYHRYRQALENGLQFLTTLQYSEANTQHFADWYRPSLLGAFHGSSQDGNIRLDHSQWALAAFVRYMQTVADAKE